MVIGNLWGKNSGTFYYNGQKITETELNSIMDENASLKLQNDEFSVQVQQLKFDSQKYKTEYEQLYTENESNKERLSEAPFVEFFNYGFFIEGTEQNINKRKSMALLDGRKYYSEDFVNLLMPANSNMTIADENVYIGKIIADKSDLFKQTVMDQYRCEMVNSDTDSYGNTYSNVLYMNTGYINNNHDYIIYILNEEYSFLSFSAAILESAKLGGNGIITIKADDQVVYTSKSLNKKTKLFTESDIPINNCTLLSIEYDSNGSNACIITEAFVYN